MYRYQKTTNKELKSAAGSINGYTPPNGNFLYDKEYATLSTSLISAVQRHISQTKTATSDILSLLDIGRIYLQGRSPYEVVMHYTPGIS